MSFNEGFRPKSIEELREQLTTTNEELGAKNSEFSLIPPSMNPRDILNMPIEEIKNKYARRYQMYLDLLRDKKYEEKVGDVKLWDKDIEQMQKWLVALNSLDNYIENHKEGEDQTLYERQFTVFEDLRKFIEAGGTEGYVKLPTGTGKTVLFAELIEALNMKSLIVVPTTLLITQTTEKIGQFAKELDVGVVYNDAKNYGRQVTITTYNSFVSQIKTGKINPADYDCLILDEVHVSLSEQRIKAVQKFDNAIKIGFTATPEFSSRKKVGNLLETEIHHMDIREAVEEGLLCSLSAVIAKTEVDLSNVKVNKQGEYDEVNLEKAVNIAGRNKAAVDLYKQNFNGELAVVYCVGIKHAQAVSVKFNQEGVSSTHISGEMSPMVQDYILKKFKTGEIKVLCNADILIAGFDEPKASVCFNLRPTKSRVVAEQRGGRVLRLNTADKDKHANIVDFLDKGINSQQKPVLFASIIEGIHIKSRSRQTGKTGRGGERSEIPIIDVPNLQIITDVEEVMRLIKEKTKTFDVKNPNDLRALLLSTKTAEELKTIGFMQFRNTLFGNEKIKGGTLLRNFGTKEENLDNLKSLIEFAGLKRGDEFDITDKKQLRNLLLSTKTEEELSTIGLTEFIRTLFMMGAIKRSGQYLLSLSGSFMPNTKNMITLLESVGIRREVGFDITNKKQLKDLLLSTKTIEELKNITTEEFLFTSFKHEKTERMGSVLLTNFGSKNKTLSNLLALLKFVGIEREQLNIHDKIQLRELLLSGKNEEELKNISLTEFNNIKFKLDNIKTTGITLLARFNKGFDGQALDALLNFAGIERDRFFDLKDPKKLKTLLLTAKTEAELKEITFTEFQSVIFAKNTIAEMRGHTLLKRFANKGLKSLNTKTMLELFKFVGIERDDFDINDQNDVRKLLLSAGNEEELKQIGVFKFIKMIFRYGKVQYAGGSLLKKFGSKHNNTDNMVALLNFAGIIRYK